MNNYLAARRVYLGAALLVFIGLGVLFALRVYQMLERTGQAAGQASDRTEVLNCLLGLPGAPFPASLNWVGLEQLNEVLPSPPGWEIRYNAAATLARLGKSSVPLEVLAEMLDEERQKRNFRLPATGGRMVVNEEEALTAVLVALKAVAAWYAHPDAVRAVGLDNPKLQKLQRALDKLANSSNPVVRTRAQEVRLQAGKIKN